MSSKSVAASKRPYPKRKKQKVVVPTAEVKEPEEEDEDFSGDETEAVVVFSDDEPDIDDPSADFTFIVPWRDARVYTLAFGKYKGENLQTMISTRERRSYLRYLCKWKEIRPSTKSNIEAALKHYDHLHTLYKNYKD